MTKGRINSAVRRALDVFDEWNDVTGVVVKHSSYYYELQGVIEDAVHCGIQAVLEVEEELPSQKINQENNNPMKEGK